MNCKHEILYERYAHFDQLSAREQQLVVSAREALNEAYAPYSNFQVGASLLLENGTVIKGSNQENKAYPSGLCAERVALFFAGSNYGKELITTMAVAAKGSHSSDKIISPCGACRQVMIETERRQNKTFRVILTSESGEVIVFHSAEDLLPMAFASEI